MKLASWPCLYTPAPSTIQSPLSAILSPQQLQRNHCLSFVLGSEAGVSADSLGVSSGTQGLKGVWDAGYTLFSEQKPNQVAVLEACTS